ncbi:alpha/beta fold hydrolase [Chitiniphilus purpureus]|uniref:Alpha/beta fold hydrolase n=1 Tax=Chitiniphilus purpureus TaxID=2981137 RepID=A0ABY6DME1_9NEIS|nr:alpha/beta fold hydrolase [Chitiniphilus sp. CD1]UXY15524.1 alpha/beta fold hydrolase [Chitiniphilus sp. CD1]
MPCIPVDLLALPCAGASATMYLRWRRALPPWIRLTPLELPGRGSRMAEPCVEDYAALVEQLCETFQPALHGRYVLFGHSMGALLAHGIAHRQRALGRPLPHALLVSASPAPSCRDRGPYPGRHDHAALLAELRRHGGTPDDVLRNEALLQLALDTLGADYRVCASFQPQSGPPLPLPIHAFGGRQDDIAPQRIEAWHAETAGHFALEWFDGGHFFIRQHEAALLAALVRVLGPLSGGTGPVDAGLPQRQIEDA